MHQAIHSQLQEAPYEGDLVTYLIWLQSQIRNISSSVSKNCAAESSHIHTHTQNLNN